MSGRFDTDTTSLILQATSFVCYTVLLNNSQCQIFEVFHFNSADGRNSHGSSAELRNTGIQPCCKLVDGGQACPASQKAWKSSNEFKMEILRFIQRLSTLNFPRHIKHSQFCSAQFLPSKPCLYLEHHCLQRELRR